MRKPSARAVFASIALALGLCFPASAQTMPPITTAFSFTSTGQALTIPLGGQSTCAVVVTSVGTSATIVPQASSDNVTYQTAFALGNGAITAIGTYTANVAPYGMTSFRLQPTALVGTATGTVTCSPALVSVAQAGAAAFVAAGVTTNTTVRAGPGRLYGVVCTTTGSNASAMNVTDGASNVLAVIPATCAAGTVVAIPTGGVPNVTSIVVNGQTGAPALTVTFL